MKLSKLHQLLFPWGYLGAITMVVGLIVELASSGLAWGGLAVFLVGLAISVGNGISQWFRENFREEPPS